METRHLLILVILNVYKHSAEPIGRIVLQQTLMLDFVPFIGLKINLGEKDILIDNLTYTPSYTMNSPIFTCEKEGQVGYTDVIETKVNEYTVIGFHINKGKSTYDLLKDNNLI